MANVKISDIAAEATAVDTDLFEIENAGGTSKSMTRANIFAGGTDGSEQQIAGSKAFTGKLGIGNSVDFSGLESIALQAKNILDDFAGTNSGTQASKHLVLTGTPANTTNKLITDVSVISGLTLDAGTAPHAYWAAYEGAIIFNPGSAYTLPEFRTFESDPTFHDGTITTHTGFNSRFHAGTPGTATISNYHGFLSHGPKGGFPSATFGDMIGYLVRYDQDVALSATFDDIYGMVIDNPDKIAGTLASTNQYGIWLNGFNDGSDITFGENKNLRLSASEEAGATGDASQLVATLTKTNAPASNSQALVGRYNLSGALGSKDLNGLNGIIATSGSGTDSTGELIAGNFATLFQGTQAVPLGAALSSQYIATAAATHAAAIGFYAKNAIVAAATLTNLDGIRVDKQTGGATNTGIFLNGDDIGADITFGAGRDVSIHWNNANLELEFAAGDPYDTTGNPVTSTGFIPIAVNGTVYKFLVAT